MTPICVNTFTIIVFHYHHYTRLIAGTEHINVCRVSCGGVSNILLVLSITFYFYYNICVVWVVCVQLAHLSIGGWEDISIAHVIIIGSIHLSHCFRIFPWLCAWDVCCIIFCHLLYTHSGKTGNLFSLLLCSIWWLQIFIYVLACRSYSFVCTLHHLIIIIVQTLSEDIELIKCLSNITCRVCE